MQTKILARWLLCALALTLSASFAQRAEAKKVYGAVLLDEVRKVEDGRYRSRLDWDKTLRHFRRVYGRAKGIVWHRVRSSPQVKLVHISNTRSKRSWDGINIYENRKKIFIYVLKSKPKEKSRSR